MFEGIDGAGKTTQARALAKNIRSLGFEVIESKEPTNGPWGQKLRASASTGRLPPRDELELFIKDRQEHVRGLIEPALADGKIVIIDRYYFSTAAYQGARGMDFEDILQQNEAFAPVPDLLFILRVEPSVGRARIAARGDEANLFEGEQALAASAEIFDRIQRPCVRRLDGTWSIAQLEHTCVEATWAMMDQRIPRAPIGSTPAFAANELLVEATLVERDDSIPVEAKAQELLNRLGVRS